MQGLDHASPAGEKQNHLSEGDRERQEMNPPANISKIAAVSVSLCFLLTLFMLSPLEAQSPVVAPFPTGSEATAQQVSEQNLGATEPQAQSLADHQAMVFNLEGEVYLLQEGASQWVPLQQGDIIHEGDQIRTGKASFVEIAYDDFYLNLARIGADTLAEFRAIEPTDVYLSDGGIFNDLEGLPSGATYEVATPTSVAGVRGTKFYRAFDAATATDTTICTRGAVEVFLLDKTGDLIPEGIKVAAGNALEMTADQVREKRRETITPRPMNEGDKQLMAKVTQIESNADHFLGDSKRRHQMEQMFQQIQKDAKQLEIIRKGFREKDEYFKKSFPEHRHGGEDFKRHETDTGEIRKRKDHQGKPDFQEFQHSRDYENWAKSSITGKDDFSRDSTAVRDTHRNENFSDVVRHNQVSESFKEKVTNFAQNFEKKFEHLKDRREEDSQHNSQISDND